MGDPSCGALIAKKVRKESNELAILKLLNAAQPKPLRIISLFDSFDTPMGAWVILPKLTLVADYFNNAPDQLAAYVVQVCWQLIEGVAYLHGLCIAHRNIKPHNLVVGADFCLRIIDFDTAIQLEHEDAEISDEYYGTETWIAPEVENEHPTYSPVKADRWSSGRVISCLLELRKEDNLVVLRAVASRLQANDPQQRPSLLEWRKWEAESLKSTVLLLQPQIHQSS